MKPPPTNPLKLADRVFATLCADILDRTATSFPRTNAIRAVVSAEKEDRRD